MTIKSTLLLFGLAIIGSPVFALSCLPPDVVSTFQQAKEAEAYYVIAHGTLKFDEKLLPKTDWDQQDKTPANTYIPATFIGKSLTRSGYTAPFEREITVNAQCMGPWCGGAVSGAEYLAFLKKTDSGYLLEVSPCGGFGFTKPTKEDLKKVKACYQGKRCKATPLH